MKIRARTIVAVILVIAAAAVAWFYLLGGRAFISGEKACIIDADCVPKQCCHANECINISHKGVCDELCTNECSSPLDCGAGSCGCVAGTCQVIPGPPVLGN